MIDGLSRKEKRKIAAKIYELHTQGKMPWYYRTKIEQSPADPGIVIIHYKDFDLFSSFEREIRVEIKLNSFKQIAEYVGVVEGGNHE